MDSVSTYSEARNEYLKQLCTWIVPYMIQHYRNVWSGAAKGGQQKAMVVFQERCAEVPKWNQDTIDENVGKLLDSCRCDYLEELMAAVFIAHTKVLIAIRVSSKHKKLQITLPKLDHFLHRVFSECARSFWKAPYLFLDDHKPIEMQKNLLQAEALCNDAIGSAVRSLLPIKNILNEYLSDDVLSAEPIIEEGEKKEPIAEAVKAPESPKVVAQVPVVAGAITSEPVVEEPLVTEIVETKVDKVDDQIKHVSAEIITESVEVPVASVEPLALATTHLAPASAQVGSSLEIPNEINIDSVLEPVSEVKNVSVSSPELAVVEKPVLEQPEEISIDTEPASVHFSNYDNVFDENSDQTSTFKYVPKDLEPGEIPKLDIKEETASPLSLDSSITSLELPGASAPIAESGLSVDEILE
jgi:hypothetical protein